MRTASLLPTKIAGLPFLYREPEVKTRGAVCESQQLLPSQSQDILGAIHIPHGAQLFPAPAEPRQAPPGLREHLRAAPLDAAEEAARIAPQADERIAAVLGGRKHRARAVLQRARRGAQVRGFQGRAVAADQDGALMLFEHTREGPMHALAEIAVALGFCRQVFEFS